MINRDRIDSIYEAIKENNINAFNDESLAKLLSMLTIEELNLFIENSYNVLGEQAYTRLLELKPLFLFEINNYIYKIESSEMFRGFCEAQKKNNIKDYIKTLNATELGELKKILTYKRTEEYKDGIDRVLLLITSEIKKKDELKTKGINIK